jgi:hypothetical protein
MPIDFGTYHVLMGSTATGDGDGVQPRGPDATRYAGHYGLVAPEPAVVLVDGYFHDLRPNRRPRYSIRLSAGFGSYAGAEVDVSDAPAPRRGGQPDRIDIPTLALHLPVRPVPPLRDRHWEQPDAQQPFDLRWDIFDVDEEPALRLLLAYRIIPV